MILKLFLLLKGAIELELLKQFFLLMGIVEFDKYSKSYLLLQEMRDEAHRFAISAQRKKKKNT
jgi:excinuclease UvrABC nuclease subunit